MPRIPTYQANQVGFAQTTDARFRPANDGGSIVSEFADGAQGLGRAVVDYARAEDAIQAHFDETFARRLALEYKEKAAPILSEYQALQGENAVTEAGATQARLSLLRDQTLGRSGNARMRAFLEERIAEPSAAATSAVGEHSLKQQTVLAENTYLSEVAEYSNEAAGAYEDPEAQRTHIAAGYSALDDMRRLKGWSEEQLSLERLNFTTKVHQAALDRILSAPDPDVDMAVAYLEAHGDEMSEAARTAAMKDLQAPLQFRQSKDDVARALGMIEPPKVPEPGTPAPAGTAPVAGGRQDAIRNAAAALGLKPVELAMLASYESGGTMNPRTVGGTGGNYQGIFQFGPEERRKYGIDANSTFEEQVAALVKFAKDRGFKPGMGWRKLYTTINAGNPHASLSASDGNGTQTEHYARIEREHMPAAMRFVGGEMPVGSDPEAPRTWDKDQVYNNLDQIAAQENWTPERLDRAKRAADEEIRRDEELKGRAEREADQQALEAIAELGPNFTSINQVPAAIREAMSVETRIRFEQTAQANLTRSREIPANGSESLRLQIMQRSNPDGFMREDLSRYVGKVSPEELRAFVLDQVSAQAAASKPKPAIDTRGGITSAITHGQRYGGVKLDEKDYPAVFDTMQGILAPRAATGQALTSKDYDEAFRQATRSIPTSGFFGRGSMPVYDLEMGDVSDAVRDRAAAQFKRDHGRDPKPDELLRLVRQLFATGR